jgi:hypothetical protein
MKFTTVKAMKMCPMPFCEGWLTLLFHQPSRGEDIIVLDGLLRSNHAKEVLENEIFFWKHTMNPECTYKEKLA